MVGCVSEQAVVWPLLLYGMPLATIADLQCSRLPTLLFQSSCIVPRATWNFSAAYCWACIAARITQQLMDSRAWHNTLHTISASCGADDVEGCAISFWCMFALQLDVPLAQQLLYGIPVRVQNVKHL